MTRKTAKAFAAICLGATMVMLCGCGGGGGGGGAAAPAPGPTNRAPVVTDFTVTPTALAFEGGQVTYTVVASDADGDTVQVSVQVRRPDGSATPLPTQTGPPGVYTFTHNSPGNTGATGGIETYTAVATITDGINAPVTGAGANYTVAAPPFGPPPPPPPVLP